PVAEGDRTISGGTYPMPGYGWSCTCGQSGYGYATEADAEEWCERHSEDIPSSTPCDRCGAPATWLTDDGAGNASTLWDRCTDDARCRHRTAVRFPAGRGERRPRH